MRTIRQIHLYLGILFAPAIIFFAFTGALQTFGLHEPSRDGSYKPPTWLSALAEIHKDQRLGRPHHGPPPPRTQGNTPSGARDKPPTPPQKPRSALPLKIFVLLVALGLMATASLGIYIALQNLRTRKVTWTLLTVGTALPVALLFL